MKKRGQSMRIAQSKGSGASYKVGFECANMDIPWINYPFVHCF